jgi:hypothetical protein
LSEEISPKKKKKKKKLSEKISPRNIALFTRWPRFRAKINRKPLFESAEADEYPALKHDLGTVAAVINPWYMEYDATAQDAQNSFWRQQVALIIVTALTAGFGAVQAAYSHQIWPGIVVAVLGVLSAAVAGLGEERAAQRTYLEQRVRAERLRALAFTFLAELPPFTGNNDEKRSELVNAVTAIREGREPA